jgi:hypothetical protein
MGVDCERQPSKNLKIGNIISLGEKNYKTSQPQIKEDIVKVFLNGQDGFQTRAV